ncbi:MAG: hypothetical protein KatS3mg027_1457 [Bacteroidia bacterium]|nr:MAG: hypothetical protein KatS3mg027_1457 [Bacteroidia bacterium]
MKESIIKEKSFNFALQIIELYVFLKKNNEHVISRQLLRSGTSIGANVNEDLVGVSKVDFINKMDIANKEARETLYWLELLNESQMINFNFPEYIHNCN